MWSISKSKTLTVLAGCVLFITLSVLWVWGVAEMVFWWWAQLIVDRAVMDMAERFVMFCVVAIMTLFIVPYFLWAPVLVGRELGEWLDTYVDRVVQKR
jgi:hypothetical protein